MKVSIAIPVYEMRGSGFSFLEENLERIKNQTFKNIEVVVTDHSKNDDIKNLCETYKDDLELKYFKNEKNRGNSSYNLNLAISKCTGDIVKFMMQDEYLCDVDSILKIHNVFLNPQVHWCVSSCYYGDQVNSIKGRFDPHYSDTICFGNNTIGSPSVITVRNSDIKYFDEDLIWVMDCDYYIRMFKEYGYPFIVNDPLVFVVQHEDQITSWLSKELKEKEELILRKRYNNT